jgi:hypothetical protein
MSAATIKRSEPATKVMAGRGFLEKIVVFDFPTTDLTCTVPVDLTAVESAHAFPIGAPGLALEGDNLAVPTTSATATYRYRVEKAGTITGLGFVVGTTVATDAANIWTVGVINKGSADGTGTTVVVNNATAANSNNSTGGAAFTANKLRALTLTATGADLVVAAGDVLEFTFTKASAASNLVTPTLVIQQTTASPDEIAYWADSVPDSGIFMVPSDTGVLTFARSSANPDSAQRYVAVIKGW